MTQLLKYVCSYHGFHSSGSCLRSPSLARYTRWGSLPGSIPSFPAYSRISGKKCNRCQYRKGWKRMVVEGSSAYPCNKPSFWPDFVAARSKCLLEAASVFRFVKCPNLAQIWILTHTDDWWLYIRTTIELSYQEISTTFPHGQEEELSRKFPTHDNWNSKQVMETKCSHEFGISGKEVTDYRREIIENNIRIG